MKIRIITKATFPEGMAATKRVKYISLASLKAGHEVEIFTEKSALLNNEQIGWHSTGSWEGVYYLLLRNKTPFNQYVRVIWIYIKSFLLVFKAIRGIKKVDVYVLYLDRFWPQMLVLLFAKMYRKKVVYELVEYPYATEGQFLTNLNSVRKLLRALTLNVLFPLLDGFDVISDNLIEVANKYRSSKSIVNYTPILTDIKLWNRAIKENPSKMKEDYLFHAGALSENKDGIVNFMKVFALVNNKRRGLGQKSIKLGLTNMSTKPQTLSKLKQIIAENDLEDDIFITGYLQTEELIKYQNNAAVLLFNKPNNRQNFYNFPTKLADYLLANAPLVVATDDYEMNKYLFHGINAIVTKPDDVDAMANAVLKLLNDPELSRKIANNGRETVETSFDYRNYIDRYDRFYKEVVSK